MNLITIPSKEELKDSEIKYKKASFKNPTNLSNWFPVIENLVPVPETAFFHTDVELAYLMDNEIPEGFDDFINKLKVMADKIGYPCFLRSGFTSGKHDWNDTCFVKSAENLKGCVASIVYYSELHAMFGELPTYTWVVREMLSTDPVFLAFKGMPITREFRYFVRDGVIEHVQPYWIPEAMEKHALHIHKLPENWEVLLAGISELGEDAVQLKILTEKVGRAIGGYWSLDWLWTKKGWFLTDMALGGESFKWGDDISESKVS